MFRRLEHALRVVTACAWYFASASAPALASDGVQEINQASALAAGSFPVVLSAPGSYRLTGNLDLTTAPLGTTAVSITAPDIHLDLGGFSIRGPLDCTTAAPAAGSGSGITSSAINTSIENGSVVGFASHGLLLHEQARVRDVEVRCAGAAGIRTGREARIASSSVRLAAIGIQTGANALLVGNEITRNTGFGLIAGARTSLRGNVLAENNGGDASPQLNAPSGLLELGPNRCGASLACTSGSFCGNGVPEAGERCDDDGTANGDGCSSTCDIEPGFVCVGAPSVCAVNVCGDGLVGGAEECDDQNAASGDGCSATCQVEPNYVCSGQPSACILSVCGNGIREVAEECDGVDLGGQTCQSVGFTSGTLACNPVCTIDTSACIF